MPEPHQLSLKIKEAVYENCLDLGVRHNGLVMPE